MAVRIPGVLARRGSAVVELALLNHQHEGAIAVFTAPHRALRNGDLFDCAAQVNRRRFEALGIGPRNGPIERVVHLERSGAVSVFAEASKVARRKHGSGDRCELIRTRVEEINARGRQIGERSNMYPGFHSATASFEQADQRVRDGTGAASSHRPRSHVAIDKKDEADRSADRRLEGNHRVGRAASEEGPRPVLPEAFCQAHGGVQGTKPEPRHQERMPRDADRREQVPEQTFRIAQKGGDQALVGPRILSEAGAGLAQVGLEQDRRRIVEGMRHRNRWIDPSEAVSVEGEGSTGTETRLRGDARRNRRRGESRGA